MCVLIVSSVSSPEKYTMSYYRPQRSWGKVMFLHVSVILPGPGGCLVRGRGSAPRGVPGPEGGVPGPGGSAPRGGALDKGGWSRGCGDPPPTATAAGSTHPTGMHSCFVNLFLHTCGIFTPVPETGIIIKMPISDNSVPISAI